MAEKVPVNLVTEKTNIEETLPQHLLYQWDTATNLRKLLGTFAEELQSAESDAVIPLLYERTLAQATGVQLDNIGEGLNIPRQGRSDEVYRINLRVSSLKRFSTGGAEGLLDIIFFLTGVKPVYYYRGQGYYVELGFNPSCVEEATLLQEFATLLPLMSNVRWVRTPQASYLGFEGNPQASGLGSVHHDGGGKLTSSISYADRDYADEKEPRYRWGFLGDPLTSGMDTVHIELRTDNGGELVSTTKEMSSDYNRIKDNPFRWGV